MLASIVFASFAQNNSPKIAFYILPQNSIIELNDSVVNNFQQHDLKKGENKIKIWAPKREILEQTINVSSDTIVQLKMTLAFTPEYKQFITDMGNYKKKKIGRSLVKIGKWVPLGVSAVYFTRTVTESDPGLTKKMDYMTVVEDQLNQFIEDYSHSTAISDFDELNENEFNRLNKEYESAVDKVNNHKNTNYVVSSTALVGSGVIFYMIRKNARSKEKLVKPEYTERVKLSSVYIVPHSNQISIGASLTF